MITAYIPSAPQGIVIEPTRFPDGTSQVWKVDQRILDAERVNLDWRFEAEAEFMHLASLKTLLDRAKGPAPRVDLYVPYLPYARQDKSIINGETFNLKVFARLLNMLEFTRVTTMDVHNANVSEAYIDHLRLMDPEIQHQGALLDFKPDAIVFPDSGAERRYFREESLRMFPYLVFEKHRDQGTGTIVGHKVVYGNAPTTAKRFLIIDDICDGGATFTSVARGLRAAVSNEADGSDVEVGLFVTHGLFSKGVEALYREGISRVYTTDSLPRNLDTEVGRKTVYSI